MDKLTNIFNAYRSVSNALVDEIFHSNIDAHTQVVLYLLIEQTGEALMANIPNKEDK